jgi:hypothetical protein
MSSPFNHCNGCNFYICVCPELDEDHPMYIDLQNWAQEVYEYEARQDPVR